MMRRLGLLVLAGTMIAGSADAAFVKRKMLLESCSGANEKDCTGYIVGVADASEGQVCVGDVRVPAMKAKVLGWLKAHKQESEAPAAPWVLDALKASYPCGK